VLDPDGNAEYGVERPGFFGSSGRYAFDLGVPIFKAPHFRNMYQKVGMFGVVIVPPFFHGDQIRGFGFTHGGAVDTIFNFVAVGAAVFPGFPPGPAGNPQRRAVESFLFAFDSNMAPIVGQQVTLTDANAGVAGPRIDLLVERADAGECDLVAKTRLGVEIGFYYTGGQFVSSTPSLPAQGDAELRQLVAQMGLELTYTCAPPGSGERIGIDRDGDGYRDGEELEAGSDPADPTSTP
jgi:hypothetical protein